MERKEWGEKIILAASLETNLKPWKCNIINTKRHWVIPSCFNTVSLYIHVEQPPCSESVCGSTMPLLGEFTHDCLCRGFPCQVDVLCNHKSLMEHSVCFLIRRLLRIQWKDSSRWRGGELLWHLIAKLSRVVHLLTSAPLHFSSSHKNN